MNIVALLTIHNEERYLKRCLSHLHQEGINVCIIDNGSTDRSLEIAESFRDKNVIRIEHFPYPGYFAWKPILENAERLAGEIQADWFIQHDADEIRQAPSPFRSLVEGISHVDSNGYNAVNFDEFVFVPTEDDPDHEGGDYVKSMRYYYFFDRGRKRRINAWKNTGQPVNLSKHGGHKVVFEDQRIFPASFILRHYVVLSRAHAFSKYYSRVYAENEVFQEGWHGKRARIQPGILRLPEPSQLKTVSQDNTWDRSDPKATHLFMPKDSEDNKPSLRSRITSRVRRLFPVPHDNAREYTPDVPDTAHTKDMSGRPPAPFIVGVGRSGSTLLRLMLDSHPELAIPSETHFIQSVILLNRNNRRLRKKFFHTVVNHPRWPDFHLSKDTFRGSLEAVNPFTLSEGLRTFFHLYAVKFGKKCWGDKTPGYYCHMLEIKDLLPESRFIHIIRDGRDVALSYKNKWFGPGDDLEVQATQWIWRIRECRRLAQHLPHYLEVRFEDLVEDPEPVLRKICDFIELPYSPAMLEYHKTASDRLSEMENRLDKDGNVRLSKEKRMDIFELTNKPPVKDRILRWRRDMTKEDRSRFEAIGGDLLKDLGYE